MFLKKKKKKEKEKRKRKRKREKEKGDRKKRAENNNSEVKVISLVCAHEPNRARPACPYGHRSAPWYKRGMHYKTGLFWQRFRVVFALFLLRITRRWSLNLVEIIHEYCVPVKLFAARYISFMSVLSLRSMYHIFTYRLYYVLITSIMWKRTKRAFWEFKHAERCSFLRNFYQSFM